MIFRTAFIFIGIISCSFFSCEKNETDHGSLELLKAFIGSTELNLNGETTTGLPGDRPVSLVFSMPVDPNSTAGAIMLSSSGSMVDIDINLSSQNKNIVVYPDGPLEENTLYTLSISNGLKGAGGQSFAAREITFGTAIGDPTLISIETGDRDITDQNNVSDISNDLSLTFHFSVPVEIESFEEAFSLSGPEVSAVQFTPTNSQKSVTVTSSSPLRHLSTYTLSVSSDLVGSEGQHFSPITKRFYTAADETPKFPVISDEELLTKIQEQTFKYFWDFAHPNSGLARERNSSGDLVTIGGSGFGVMAILVGIERGFITREQGVERLTKIVDFLGTADRFHGVWPHWMNGNSGDVIPFSTKDNGGDLVETAFMIQGLLTVRAYLDGNDPDEKSLIDSINALWEEVEWTWYTQGGQNVLYWHWSPNYNWEMNHPIHGYNEALIVYVLAAASPTYPIAKDVYTAGWARNGAIVNGSSYFGIQLPVGYDYGGPLFFAHYSFMGLDPRQLSDSYADYWQQNVNHSLINQTYCESNPKQYGGYSEESWGLTASDNHQGYSAHSPANDLGVITPTAALSSFPYTPDESMKALKFFYYTLGDRLWGEYGFYDAFNVTENWVADSYLAIDQGPIIVMIENHRSGLLWDLFMENEEVKNGLDKLGFEY